MSTGRFRGAREAVGAPRLVLVGLLGLILVVGLSNARTYPPGAGYDASHHLAYADGLIHHGRLPPRVVGPSEVETPPAYYAVAGAGWWLGEQLGLGEPLRAALALNALMLLGTALLALALARLLFPARPWLWVAALAFFAFLPVVAKTAAMFHPDNLNLLLSTLALFLGTRMIVLRAFGFLPALGVGVAAGADLLTRRAALFTYAAVLLALAAVALLERRPRALAAAAVVAVVGAAMYAPFELHLRSLEAPAQTGIDNVPPALEASFFADLGLPAAFSTPWRPHFTNRVFPMTYTETWGDFFGAFAWSGRPPPAPAERWQLRSQAALGALPTVLAVAGWLLLLAAALRRRSLLPSALLPGIALAGFLWFTAHTLAPDGDVIKATYILNTAPAWAVAFACALGRLPRRALVPLVALLVLSALVDLRFLVYGTPLGIL